MAQPETVWTHDDDVQRTMTWIATVEHLETVSDATLAELLMEHVWALSPLKTLQNDLVAEAIARLRGER
jgi:hypothetical protein